jgi:hypothetical protein
MRPRPVNRSRLRWLAIGATMLAALVIPAAAHAGAQQVVIQVVDEPVPLEFDDPCTGLALHGIAVENGVIRITDLGDGGYHERLDVRGTADLFDDQGSYVGTWSYRLTFRDQYPPDGQGAVSNVAVGPIDYADGQTALIQGHTHEVFGKGDALKLEFFMTHCARG